MPYLCRGVGLVAVLMSGGLRMFTSNQNFKFFHQKLYQPYKNNKNTV